MIGKNYKNNLVSLPEEDRSLSIHRFNLHDGTHLDSLQFTDLGEDLIWPTTFSLIKYQKENQSLSLTMGKWKGISHTLMILLPGQEQL